ncbi:hypothetical protein KOR34_26100 [Posidoniimonas corsicana]|uniref:Uncharacterized protein n=1 Tax=Posidoniimonas corsicana TaxID=1938618 RepID=A0A5C5VIX5_9BACT|nr:hypothetical protein KOR34_26100 [Posidoniimonas corsicana]
MIVEFVPGVREIATPTWPMTPEQLAAQPAPVQAAVQAFIAADAQDDEVAAAIAPLRPAAPSKGTDRRATSSPAPGVRFARGFRAKPRRVKR